MSVTARLRGHAPEATAAPVVAVPEVAAIAPAGSYVGLVTRALAFGIDAAIINGIALITTAIVTLTFRVLSLPDELKTVAIAAGGALYILWTLAYFITFWSTTGQTPGSRVMRMRVCATDGGRLLPRRSLLRFLGLIAAAIPLFAGYLMILVDNRRRGLQDVLARTVVVDAERDPLPQRGRRPRDRA
jgi:uncharacterized RDD family membrane protein YckC